MRRIGPARLAALLVLSLLVGLNLILPAGAHVTKDLPHLLSHLDPRYINANEKAANSNLLDGQDSSAFLGANAKAADANLLDGQDSTAFYQGGGRVFAGSGIVNSGTIADLLTVPDGFGTLSLNCSNSGSGGANINLGPTSTNHYFLEAVYQINGAPNVVTNITTGAPAQFATGFMTFSAHSAHSTLHLLKSASNSLTFELFTRRGSNASDPCIFSFQAWITQ
jgi:hypothetical protein